MRRGVGVVAVLLWLGALLAGTPSASAAGGEKYLSWDVDYAVQADGSVDVTETLEYQFAGSGSHGLKRWIITSQGYDPDPDKYRVYAMSDVSATSPTGAPTDIRISDRRSAAEIRIGHPDKTVSGVQKYVLKYTLAHVVNVSEEDPDATELYINATGDENAAPIEKFSATMSGPGAVRRAICFQGRSGSDQECQASASGGEATFSASDIQPGEGVTISGEMPTSAFTDTSMDLRDRPAEDDSDGFDPNSIWADLARGLLTPKSLAGALGLPALAAGAMGLLFWTRGRDESYQGLTPGVEPADGMPRRIVRGGRRPVAVRFTPPDDVTPGMMGTIFDKSADTIDVSATIVDLAVRGFLTIEKTKRGILFSRDDWLLRRPHQVDLTKLSPYEVTIFRGLFKGVHEVRLSSLNNTFYTSLAKAQKQMYEQAMHRGWFDQSPQGMRGVFRVLGTLVTVGVGVYVFFSISSGGITSSKIGLFIGGLAAGAIITRVGAKMSSRTAKGSAVLAQTLGFKQYLATAEAGQIRFEEAEGIFSRYLPYAMVFGLADRWAEVFDEVARSAAAAGQQLEMPVWYLGASVTDFSTIAGSMENFGRSASSTLSSSPSSSTSGSSGGSGFSGGSSGGGVSGGGSSSW